MCNIYPLVFTNPWEIFCEKGKVYKKGREARALTIRLEWQPRLL